MFDSDQLHQFIAASSRANSSLANIHPLSFPLHGNPSFSFDPNNYHNSSSLSLLHHHQEPPPPPPPAAATKNHHHDVALSERSMDPWSNDEVLALLKLRSSMEIWFPDFTWEHVSRKLTELGYKRTPDECKEKFEDESRHFNSVNQSKIFSELDELYTTGEEARFSCRNTEKVIEVDQEKEVKKSDEDDQAVVKKEVAQKKMKRSKEKFEMYKGFCEAVVKKMMDKQEELHNKMIDDILKRDQEKTRRDEAWKNEEMARVRNEMEMRSKEQARAADRQGTIIEFLKKFTSDHNNNNYDSINGHDQDYQTLKSKIDNLVYKNDELIRPVINPSHSGPNPSPKPNTLVEMVPPSSSEFSTKMGVDMGKRWPRDEVLALINLRCKMSGNNGINNNNEDNEGGGIKGPLWERISQGMMELGYMRNAKRCKEKWENINKYFRKTKDSNKKRSVNSRTCPYFHQLSSLYTEGTIQPVGPNNVVHEFDQ